MFRGANEKTCLSNQAVEETGPVPHILMRCLTTPAAGRYRERRDRAAILDGRPHSFIQIQSSGIGKKPEEI